MIAAAVIGAVNKIGALWTTHPALVEQAKIAGGSWGPSRTLYRCMPNGLCLAPHHVVFDSIANDPEVGNETAFMGAKIQGNPGPMQNSVSVKIGDTVVVRAFVENDAAMNIGHHPSSVARGTRFSLSLPTNDSMELPIIGHITAKNASPKLIYDGIFLHSTERFTIEYDWGSAILSNREHRGLPLSDNLLGEGTLVGYNKPNGIFPPGLANGAAVFFLVRIVPPTAWEPQDSVVGRR